MLPGYVEALGVPLLRGRDVSEADGPGAPMVVVVSRSFAERFWPGQDPIGRRVKRGRFDSDRPWMTVVGVVGDVKERQDPNDGEIIGTWYLPYRQQLTAVQPTTSFVVRTVGLPAGFAAAARQAIWAGDKDLPAHDLATMESLVRESLAQERFAALLVGLFGAVGLSLAAVGIYGVLAYGVSRRRHELGVRIALGSPPRRLVVLGHGLRLTITGMAIGLAGTLGLTRLLASLLHGVSATDPATFVGVCLLLGLVAVAACGLPARRAMKIDAMASLRWE